MNGGDPEALCLRLLDIARKQKAALETTDLDEAMALAGTRRQLLQEIQEIDCFPAPSLPLIRQVLSLDEESADIARTLKRGISMKISEINTLKVCYQGAVDGARPRSGTV